MCKVRDIIIVKNYEHNGKAVNKHSFVVIDDEADQIQGLDYDFVANVMSSFKDEEQKLRKLSYPGNFPIGLNDRVTNPDNGKEAYIKTEQLYYFNKEKISFTVIGSLNEETYNKLIYFINNLIEETDGEIIEEIVDNL